MTIANRAFNTINTPKGLPIYAKTKKQSDYIGQMENNAVTFGVGPAGTGKTFLAVAFAAAAFHKGEFKNLILTRPAKEAGEELGFLPGSMGDKMDPYMRPLYDALFDVMDKRKVRTLLSEQTFEIAPLAFMRGRTFKNSLVILDEAQNTSVEQMKMFLTRLGEGSKMIITGDPSQIDLGDGTLSGLADALDALDGVPEIGRIDFSKEDIVRRDTVANMVAAYDKRDARKGLPAALFK